MKITNIIKEGENSVKITLDNTLRSLLGPHHHWDGELIAVGPVSFTGAVSWPDKGSGEIDWYDVRLKSETGKWRDDYFMVPFGIIEAPIIVSR